MKKTIVLFYCLPILVAFSSFGAKASNKPPKPNIIILYANDLGWVDLGTGKTNGGRGSKIYNTPTINKLATEGMSFTNAYSQQNSAPARASLITGQYATGSENGVYNVNSLNKDNDLAKGTAPMAIKPPEQLKVISEYGTTIFDMLQGQGYHTTWIGKSEGTPYPFVGDYGLDTAIALNNEFTVNANGQKRNSFYLAINDEVSGWTFNSAHADRYAQPYDENYIKTILAPFKSQTDIYRAIGSPKHITDAIGDMAVDCIKNRVGSKNPFMLYVPFQAVGAKVVGRKDLTQKYIKKGLDPKIAEYASLIELLDENIAKINHALKDPNGDGDFSDDISSNTLLIVYSDNGGVFSNGPLTGKKGVFTEGGIRVPLICKWPGVITPNAVSNQAVHCIDFFPTLAEFAGIEPKNIKKSNGKKMRLDGISFAKILTGENSRLERENLFWHFPGYMDVRVRPTTVIQKRIGEDYYKMFYSYENDEYQLFQLNKDIGEKINLLKKPTPQQLEIALQMNTDMHNWLDLNSAPTGTWVKDGSPVPYPKADGVLKHKK